MGNNFGWESMGIDGHPWASIVRLLVCSMLAAGFGSVLVAGLGLAGLTSTPVAALHVSSERLLAGFDALSGVSHARAPEESASSWFEIARELLWTNLLTFLMKYLWFWNLKEAAAKP